MYTHGLSISNYGIYFNEDSTRTELVLLLRLKILHSLFLYEEFYLTIRLWVISMRVLADEGEFD